MAPLNLAWDLCRQEQGSGLLHSFGKTVWGVVSQGGSNVE